LQGDVIAILNDSGTCVAEYSYDAWGNCTVTKATDTIAYDNPLRYRGYYYDFDSGLYYFQSRFYDANTGRFINADDADYIGINGGIVSNNLFAYCDNNPVNKVDPSGKWVVSAGIEIGAAAVFGVFVMIGINYDGKDLSVGMTIGFSVITNISAYISGYFAYYPKMKSVNKKGFNGFNISTGASFSFGVYLSGGGAAEFSSSGNGFSLGVGAGVSIAPVPYWQVKFGWTWTLVKWNISKTKNGYSKTKSHLGVKCTIIKRSKYTDVYIKKIKKRIRVYYNKKVRII